MIQVKHLGICIFVSTNFSAEFDTFTSIKNVCFGIFIVSIGDVGYLFIVFQTHVANREAAECHWWPTCATIIT